MKGNLGGAIAALIAVTAFTINDTAIKFLSGSYALHQVVLIRSLIGLALICLIVAPLTDGFRIWRTQKLRMHLLRGTCVVAANMTFFLGLAALPLAEAVAIFFINPLLIAVFSVIFLGERVGPWRWVAILTGLAGVIHIVQPGSDAFQTASLYPLTAAIAYASIHMITRRIGPTETAATMAFYIQITFIIICTAIGLAIGDGRLGPFDDPSLDFLTRAWTWPQSDDTAIFLLIGTGIAVAGYFISQAYRLGEAAFVAPFEYIAVPLSIYTGWLVFGEIPDNRVWTGAALIVAGGLIMVWRENRRPKVASQT